MSWNPPLGSVTPIILHLLTTIASHIHTNFSRLEGVTFHVNKVTTKILLHCWVDCSMIHTFTPSN